MSLISDALKEAEKKKNEGSGDSSEYLQTAFEKKGGSKGALYGALAVAVLIFAVIAGGGYFIFKYKDAGKLKQPAGTPQAVQVQSVPQSQQATPVNVSQPQQAQNNPALQADNSKSRKKQEADKTSAVPETIQFKDPFGVSTDGGFDAISPYQLKAIFYDESNSKNSSAIVNNSIVKIGVTLTGGAKVIDINRENITIRLQGKKIKLTLP